MLLVSLKGLNGTLLREGILPNIAEPGTEPLQTSAWTNANISTLQGTDFEINGNLVLSVLPSLCLCEAAV